MQPCMIPVYLGQHICRRYSYKSNIPRKEEIDIILALLRPQHKLLFLEFVLIVVAILCLNGKVILDWKLFSIMG